MYAPLWPTSHNKNWKGGCIFFLCDKELVYLTHIKPSKVEYLDKKEFSDNQDILKRSLKVCSYILIHALLDFNLIIFKSYLDHSK